MKLIRKSHVAVVATLLLTLSGCASVPLFNDDLAKCSELQTTPNTRAELTVVNNSSKSYSLSWVQPYTAELTYYKDIGPGESHKQDTYIGHLWATKQKKNGGTSTVCVSSAAFTHELKPQTTGAAF